MTISSEHVMALRAYLALEADRAERLNKELVESGRVDGYGELVYAAFVVAARRRFSSAWTVSDIVRFVSTVRKQLLDDQIEIDPKVAETLIRRAMGDNVAGELDQEAKARTQLFLLSTMIIDEDLDDIQLDKFMSQARSVACL